MLKIGEFSSLVHVSVRTLRHYDEVGLLRPERIDAQTGYRYYSVSQLPRLYRILALRDLGFPLERITGALEEGVTAESLRGMLLLHKVEQEDRVQEQMERLDRLKALLYLIEQEGQMTGDVILKEVEPQWIVSLREKVPAYRLAGPLFGKLYTLLGPHSAEAGAGLALLHDTDYREDGVDIEAGVRVQRPISVEQPLMCYELPRATVAGVVHHGAFNRIAAAYAALLRWMEANGFRTCGPTREIFLRISIPVSREDASNVTEIQVPVAKQ